MTKVLIILLLALTVEAVGVVFLKKGLMQIGEPRQVALREITALVGRGVANPNLLFGVALEAAFFGALLYLLSQKDVSLIWPLTSLGFVITALSAKLLLQEEVSALRWAGVALIVLGASLISYSEQARTGPSAQHPTVAAESGR
jgi:drug/metabolite transporter (DMT)-like permease